jgi:glycosyltransferase involved in cell wall biosynthesis
VRIALFHNLPSGGAKRHVREQARELARRGHELTEFCPATAEVDVCPLGPYVRETHVFAAGAERPLAGRIPLLTPYVHALQALVALRGAERVQRRIAAAIDAGNFDVALVQDCRVAMTPYVLRRLRTRAAFFCHHGFAHWPSRDGPTRQRGRAALKARYYAPARWLLDATRCAAERRNARRAGVVFAASRFARAEIRSHYGIEALVVGAGVDASVFAPAAEPRADFVLSVGELSPRKDHAFLVEALARVPAQRRPPLLIAANAAQPGTAAALERRAADCGVQLIRVQINDDRALAALYAAARLFVYAPRREMLGLACLEAMSCGTPVVAVRDGGVAETVLDGVTGWLTERDPAAFAARIRGLLADDALRARMGAAASEYVRAEWTWPAAIDRLEAALAREVTGGRS